MNKIYIALILLIGLGACRKEDDLQPTGARDDYFTVSPDATDPESVLRREFYETNGIHLLFNDTLRHEQAGTYEDGTPYWFTETIAPEFSMTANGEVMEYIYLTEQADKEKTAEITEQYILLHLNGALLPYSVFWTQDMLSEDRWGDKNSVNYFIGMRCFVFNYNVVKDFSTADEFEAFYSRMFYNIISDKLKSCPAFAALSEDYYEESYEDFSFSEDEPPTEEDFNKLGFLEKEYDDWFFEFPSESTDIIRYLRALFDVRIQPTGDVSRAELAEKCEKYPIIRQKTEILKKAVEDLGYKF